MNGPVAQPARKEVKSPVFPVTTSNGKFPQKVSFPLSTKQVVPSPKTIPSPIKQEITKPAHISSPQPQNSPSTPMNIDKEISKPLEQINLVSEMEEKPPSPMIESKPIVKSTESSILPLAPLPIAKPGSIFI